MLPNKNVTRAIFRCAIGKYDVILPERVVMSDTDYFLFTDNPNLKVFPYTSVHVDVVKNNASLTNREIKLKIPEILRNYDVTIYLDSNIAILKSIRPLIEDFLSSGKELGSFVHPYFTAMEEEVDSCIRNGKAVESVIKKEVQMYKSGCAESPAPLSDNSILIRRKPSENFLNAMSYWFEQVEKYSGRDQVSLPWVKIKFNIDDYYYNFSPRSPGNPYFLVFPHIPSSNGIFGSHRFNFMVQFLLKLSIREYNFLRNFVRRLNA